MTTTRKLVASALFAVVGVASLVAVLAVVGIFIQDDYEEIPDVISLYYLGIALVVGLPPAIIGIGVLRGADASPGASPTLGRARSLAAALFALTGAAIAVGAFFLNERLSETSSISETTASIWIAVCVLAIVVGLSAGFRLLGRGQG